ncbi:ABC transporter permease [Dyella nitratireducens]|uniref:ABC transporter ATP-binding protein n=1 Tax=Dyella nitratireducens TaxID=1849580 RepID=A0ABQ1FNB4_9GAMM|nr:ABC transporter permease [Dyella nitratireducens]GGA22698.1 ABC transporter ATP-binding protein [Dyella nitratireducens]GLQ44076.1 ABC transporter ATP-binding protein [Dyella nitratireducens]
MLTYYFQLGVRSLKRNPMLTALMVMAIGFGVAASMITYSVFRAVSGDPIPEKSSRLFVPQIDSWGPQYNEKGEPPGALNYVDAMALMKAHQASRMALIYQVMLSALPHDANSVPVSTQGFAATADFFTMFDVPFLYGSGWDATEDDNRAADIVLTQEFNQRMFGGANSVGKSITLSGHDYRIVGVSKHWDPSPRFYDAWGESGFNDPPDFYLVLNRALDLRADNAGRNSCRGTITYNGWDEFLQSNCVWLMPWVELDSSNDVARYRQFLESYSADQQRAGRFGWVANVRLPDVMKWLDVQHVVPPESRISLIVAMCFFVICLVNTVGLLLAKFMRRSGEIGVRRALGATRHEIYAQYLVEAAAVGLAGGLLGLLLTIGGMSGVGLLFEPDIARLAHVDVSLIGLTFAVAIFATVAAAFYPAWRAAQVQPAWQLKSN